MPILMLLSVLGTTPKVQDPDTILKKFDSIAFQNTNLSLQELNTLKITRKMPLSKTMQFEGYESFNISSHDSIGGLKLVYRFGGFKVEDSDDED